MLSGQGFGVGALMSTGGVAAMLRHPFPR